MKPLIGITTYVEPARWGVWDTRAALVPHDYVRQVAEAGGRPVLLPPDDDPDVLYRLDGLLLAGGADVGPDRYGEPAHPRTVSRPDRDHGEAVLLRTAIEADLPVLGVCRGMQLMAVEAGGTLHQHLPDLIGDEYHQPAPGVYGTHDVRVADGTRLAGILGAGTVSVNSYHHQAVGSPGSMVVVAYAPDGVAEAVEYPDRTFAVGVQWHPEVLTDGRLFRALVEAAADRRERVDQGRSARRL